MQVIDFSSSSPALLDHPIQIRSAAQCALPTTTPVMTATRSSRVTRNFALISSATVPVASPASANGHHAIRSAAERFPNPTRAHA